MPPTVEELWDAVRDGDAAVCERLVVGLEGERSLTPAALVKVADIFARSGDVDGVARMEQRAQLRPPFRANVWSGLRIKALAVAHDLSGGVEQLKRMRSAGVRITAPAIVPLLRAAVREREVDVMLTCLETMAELNLELQPQISETVRRALMTIGSDPAMEGRLGRLIDGWPAERGKLLQLADMARLDDGRIEQILAALDGDDVERAARELRLALVDGLVPDRGVTRRITSRLPAADCAEIEHLILTTSIAKGERPGAPFCTQVLGNYARLGDSDGVGRVLDEMLGIGVQLSSAHLATALSGAVKAQDPELLVRALDLLLGEQGVVFDADHQHQVLMACGTPAVARSVQETFATYPKLTALAQHTAALVALVAGVAIPVTEAVAAIKKALDAGRSLPKPYWDALIAVAPEDAARLIVRSLFQRLEAGQGVSPAFCTQVLSVLAGEGDLEQIRKVLTLMRRHDLEINDVHLGAVIHRFSGAGDANALRAVVDTLIELRIPLPEELLDWVLRGWDSDPQELCDHLREHAAELSLSSPAVENARIRWLAERDRLDEAPGTAERLRPHVGADAETDEELAAAADRAGRAMGATAALRAFLDGLPESPDWYDAGEVFDVLSRRVSEEDAAASNVVLRLIEVADDAAAARRYARICERLGAPPDLAVHGALLSRHVDEEDVRGAEEVLNEALGAGLRPDERMFGDMVRAYAQAGDLDAARRLLDQAREAGV